ncbi:MAG TPA: DMT family transporter [Terriglobales bacterium]|jgi:drug/metabolite transporter (DMT)-like permease|nr:DMT family transporter [Terriglobales bacterium]
MSAQRGGWINFAALVLVNLLWAAQYPAYKIAGDNMEPAALNFWTLVFASLLLLPLWLRERSKHKAEIKPFQWKTLREYCLLGVLGILPPSVMLTWGIAHSSASNAAILSLTIPVLMTGLGIVMLGEKLTIMRGLCLILGVIGTLLISANDLANASFNRSLLLGNFVLLLAGLGSAFYNTYSKDLLSRYSELQVLLYSYVVAIAGCAIISAGYESKPFYRITGYSSATWLAVAVLGVLSWGVAMILWMWVLNRLEVGQVSTSIYLLPLFGLILSVVTVHDRITLPQLIGGALTVAGTGALTLYEGRRTAQLTAGAE